MPRDYENIDGLEEMTDEELRERILEEFAEYPSLDREQVEVSVRRGRITLSGRVGTEREYQEFEHVVTDVLGLADVTNDLVVDSLVRREYAEPADEAAVEVVLEKGATGAGADRTTETADHLLPDTLGQQFGTNDASEAIERGYAYDPPTGPIQEGTESREQH